MVSHPSQKKIREGLMGHPLYLTHCIPAKHGNAIEGLSN